MWLHEVIASGADLILGAACPGCAQPGPGACSQCREAIGAQTPFLIGAHRNRLPLIAAAGEYVEPLRGLLAAAKERSALGLLPMLGHRLALAVALAALTARPNSNLALVPVPSVRSRVAERGLDFPLALAGQARRWLVRAGVWVEVGAWLGMVRSPSDQAHLGRAERARNLAGAFTASQTARDRHLILVDDITTTGATLVEAARAACGAGGIVCGAAVVAATPLQAGHSGPLVR